MRISCCHSVLYACKVAGLPTIISPVSMDVNGRKALALLREQRHWSQEEVGRRMGGRNKSAISRLETGDQRLDLPTLDEYLKVLDLTPSQYCRLIDALEELDERVAYPTQTKLPFEELRDASVPSADRVAVLGDPDLEAAERNLMEGVRLLLRSHYRALAAKLTREDATMRPPRAR